MLEQIKFKHIWVWDVHFQKKKITLKSPEPVECPQIDVFIPAPEAWFFFLHLLSLSDRQHHVGLCSVVNGFQGFVPDSTLPAEIQPQPIIVVFFFFSDMHSFIFNTRDLCFDISGSGYEESVSILTTCMEMTQPWTQKHK